MERKTWDSDLHNLTSSTTAVGPRFTGMLGEKVVPVNQGEIPFISYIGMWEVYPPSKSGLVLR